MYSYESDEEEGHVIYANPDSFFASSHKAEKAPENVDVVQKVSSFSVSLARFKAWGCERNDLNSIEDIPSSYIFDNTEEPFSAAGEHSNTLQEIEHDDYIAPLTFAHNPQSPPKEQTPSKSQASTLFDKPQHWKSSEKKTLKPLVTKPSTQKKNNARLSFQQHSSSLKPVNTQQMKSFSFQPSWLKPNDENEGFVSMRVQKNLEDTFEDFADNMEENRSSSEVHSATILSSTKKPTRTSTAKAGSLKWRYMKVVRDNSSAKLWSNAFSKGEQGFGLENPKNRFTKLFEVRILEIVNNQSIYVQARVQVIRIISNPLQRDGTISNTDAPIDETRKIDHTDFQAIALFKRQSFNHDWMSLESTVTIKIYNPIQIPISLDTRNPYIQRDTIQGWQSIGDLQQIILCSNMVEVVDS